LQIEGKGLKLGSATLQHNNKLDGKIFLTAENPGGKLRNLQVLLIFFFLNAASDS
jgi:hypothetical protein